MSDTIDSTFRPHLTRLPVLVGVSSCYMDYLGLFLACFISWDTKIVAEHQHWDSFHFTNCLNTSNIFHVRINFVASPKFARWEHSSSLHCL